MLVRGYRMMPWRFAAPYEYPMSRIFRTDRQQSRLNPKDVMRPAVLIAISEAYDEKAWKIGLN